MAGREKTFSRGFMLFLILLGVYLLLTLPFKVMEIIPGFTDIRPMNLMQPVYGIFFGIPGIRNST